MNKWCFFYTAFGLILYTPQLAAASRNKYGIGVREINVHQRKNIYLNIRYPSFVMWVHYVKSSSLSLLFIFPYGKI